MVAVGAVAVGEGEGSGGAGAAAGAAGAQKEHAGTAMESCKLAASADVALVREQLAPHPAIAALAVHRQCGTPAHLGSSKGGAAGSGGSSTLCVLDIHELNEEAIELVFTFLPLEDRRSAASVCRLWRRVHNSSTKLWGSVLLSGERIVQAAASSSAGSIVSWLAARLEAMRNVRLWSPYPLEAFASSLAQLLSRENRLQSFSYVCNDASVSRLLGELQGLTSLQLLDILSPGMAPGQGLVVRARELAKLKPLRNLLSLKLHAREIRGALPPALFRCLDRLQHLAISAKCCLPASVVQQLTGLQSLELHGANMDEAAAEAAAALQQLTRLGISVHSWPPGQHEQRQQAGGGRHEAGSSSGSGRGGNGAACGGGSRGGAPRRWQDHPIWGQLPLLARLQQLAVGAELPVGGYGEDGVAETSLIPYDALEGSVPDGIMDCSSLTHLVLPVALTCLPDLVPGQLPHLLELDLTHSIVEALPASWCCNMQKLRRLVLNGTQLAGCNLPPEFAALQGLRQLELRACRLQKLPACVAQLTGLTHLDVGINCLTSLPRGPYLGSLRHLGLRSNALAALPSALAAAQQLQVLDMGENEELVLKASDVDSVLACMPDLRHLVLSRQPAGFGFGPYISADSGAAWDAQSVGVLMQLARSLPSLHVVLERTEHPSMQPPSSCEDE